MSFTRYILRITYAFGITILVVSLIRDDIGAVFSVVGGGLIGFGAKGFES